MRKQNGLGKVNEEVPMQKSRFPKAQIMGIGGLTPAITLFPKGGVQSDKMAV